MARVVVRYPFELTETLSRALGSELAVFRGDSEALHAALVESGAPDAYVPLMVNSFATVAAGFWRVTDTVNRLLGRKPGSYAQWLERNLAGVRAAS